ncbi:carboxymuconolactone decarboxylase family protein [Bombilactobacillus bombi]|uniref:carboxymuconolactone decarboxylase family protein n=1 Tax=Bombilactobacillus bombi TaxID=1303590 RepID=UPI0015E6175F|nr:carboxymuconolactone decarboxylase family protein [Bombilactobacillus bombi]MBA1433894.1 carboxymuconolactone decarboxylase family protein [Bombilactobacillus bombi]
MTELNRLALGKKTLASVDGPAADNVMNSLKDVAPDVGKYIFEFAFGDIYNRPILNLKQREMITITSLLTQGDTAAQLDVHINASLNVGWKKEEIIETFIQCIPYVGFPKVLNAINVAKEVFKERE